MNIIGEKDIYRLIFKSRKPEAEAFQDWVYETIRELRKASGLEGYETFKLLDKEHQKEAMKKLTRTEFIARAVADRRKDKLRGQKEAYWVRSAHIDAERRKKR